MNDDLREVFDVRGGVLVYSVGANTPAGEAGLRGGDVVVSADDQKIESLADLERIIGRDGDRSVKLTVVRKRREQSIHLKW
jgi:S1-C subfamily serine protease